MPTNPLPPLLHGPYHPPALQVGDRPFCLLRDADVVITSWTDAPISWPRCRAIGRRGGSGLLLDEVLARAVRGESADAVKAWWSINGSTVAAWRKLLGVTRVNNPETHRLTRRSAALGAEVIKAREWSEEEREQHRRISLELNLGRHLPTGYHGPRWTPEEDRLVRELSPAEAARQTGRSLQTVYIRRQKLKVTDGRRKG